MVWQDMMFSCRFYPMLDDDYTRNSNIEVRENVARIQHHASIVMWDLHNEGEDMMYWGVPDKNLIITQYYQFYIDNLMR